MRILVTGVNGMLGHRVASSLAANPAYTIAGMARNRQVELTGVEYYYVDLADTAAVQEALAAFTPGAIVHCAANVNIKDCEEHKEAAYRLHVEASALLAGYDPNARFIYISTDSVYNGIAGNFTEQDLPGPVNYYAATKLQGEEAVLESSSNALVLRTNIYGFSKPLKSSLAEWAITKLSAGEAISGFDDIYFNPLYTGQLAQAMPLLLEAGITGVMNMGAEEAMSKYDFIKKIARAFSFDMDLIAQRSAADFPEMSNRPKNTVLNTGYLKDKLGIDFSLEEGINMLHKDFKNTFI